MEETYITTFLIIKLSERFRRYLEQCVLLPDSDQSLLRKAFCVGTCQRIENSIV